MRASSVEKAKQIANIEALKKAKTIQGMLNEDMAIARSLAYGFEGFEDMSDSLRRLQVATILDKTLRENPKYESVWVSMELKFVDPAWTENYGRIMFAHYVEDGIYKNSERKRELTGNVEGSNYYALKLSKKEEFSDPYPFDNFSGDSRDLQRLGFSTTVPLLVNGEFAGIVGADFAIDDFVKLSEFTAFDNSFAFCIANNGDFVATGDKKMAGTNYSNLPFLKGLNVKSMIDEGRSFSGVVWDEAHKREVYTAIVPIEVGRSPKGWAAGVMIPMEEITREFNVVLINALVAGFVGLVLLTLVIWRFSNWFSEKIEYTNHRLQDLAAGKLIQKKKMSHYNKDEIGQMIESLETLNLELNRKSSFSNEIGEGNLEAELTIGSDEDMLGTSLVKMRDSLRKTNEEDTKRRWINEGMAKFGVLLQATNQDLETFSVKLISELVKYMGANQGGLFIFNDQEEPCLELMGAYAYEKRKYLNKTIEIGQGLIGQVYLEKETMLLKEVPENYVNITSGLGQSTPKYLLIVPLKLNDEVYGVIELASFKDFEPYKIKFIEQVGESMASTISNVKVGAKTKVLLEETQQNSEELKAQEEEMRQNMEELEATQEELDRKSKESEVALNNLSEWQHNVKSILDGAYYGILVVDLNGKIKDINSKVITATHKEKSEVETQTFADVLDAADFRAISENVKQKALLKRKNGTTLPVSIVKTKINKSDGDCFMFQIDLNPEEVKVSLN